MTFEETQHELDAGLEIDPASINLDLPPEEMLLILQRIRHDLAVEYQKLITFARLNEKVGNDALAKQQREQATKLVLQVHELDQEIKALA